VRSERSEEIKKKVRECEIGEKERSEKREEGKTVK
jgi:hypothetical protein